MTWEGADGAAGPLGTWDDGPAAPARGPLNPLNSAMFPQVDVAPSMGAMCGGPGFSNGFGSSCDSNGAGAAPQGAFQLFQHGPSDTEYGGSLFSSGPFAAPAKSDGLGWGGITNAAPVAGGVGPTQFHDGGMDIWGGFGEG